MIYLKKTRALLATSTLVTVLMIIGNKAIAARPPAGTASLDTEAQAVNFNRDVLPILQASCVACHGAEKSDAGLRLDSEKAVLQGGVSGKVVIAGKGQESLLVKRILGLGDAPRMPIGSNPLPKTQIDKIRAWIDQASFAVENPLAAPVVATGSPEIAAGTSPKTVGVESPAQRGPNSSGSVRVSGIVGDPVGGPIPKSAAAEARDFVTKIRPILYERCVSCHGPQVQQNGLRLDSLAGILAGGASGKIVIPGNGERSPLLRRLLGLVQPRMPYGAPPLSSDQISLIRSWVDRGAQGPDTAESLPVGNPTKHWAYVKPVRPQLPEVKNPGWCRNGIDTFVLARLEKEGLSPSPEASKEILIRRVSLDLIGLPPTLQEVNAFLTDTSPDAYERLVDRLLASPHYGERWARPWLDLARYADTHGYEKDDRRVAWKFRDWVVDALNRNLSFKDFTIEQIAGDMLPNATVEQRIATGFHRNTMLNQEGGVDDEEYRWYNLIDRVNTTAAVWLGTTLACAQCHNHKYDPFTQKDFYKFLAFFDNSEYQIVDLGQGEGWVVEPELELPTPEQEAKSKDLKAEIAKLQTVLDTSTPELEAAQANWEKEMKRADENWTVLRPARYASQGGATLTLLPDGSLLAGGKNPEADSYTLQARVDRPGITGVRIEVLGDPSLPQGGPGRDPEGNFFLSGVEVEIARAEKPDAVEQVLFTEALADESQGGYDASNLVSKKIYKTGWAIDAAQSVTVPRRQLVLLPEKPFGFEQGTLLTLRLKHEMRHASRNIGRFRLSFTSTASPKSIVNLPARLWPVLDIPVERRGPEQNQSLAAAYRSISPLLQPARDRLEELKKSLQDLGIVTAMVLQERNNFERPATDFRNRGSYLNRGDKVYAGVPSALNPLPENQMPNRLGLARWLVDDDNPLTARVTVNRYWEAMFGRGIVETSEDFGTQGERPTHPELLDWLATEFVQNGWDVKALHRLIVTSSTYRQSSATTPALAARDPYNRLLARGPRFRVEAEMVRDIALAAGGLLSPKISGPSVFPYQPEGIWDRPYSEDRWVMSEGEERYRRGIYTFIRRTAAYPSLVNFDAPSREFCTVRRPRTNTPLQALTTLNDPVFFEAAQALARRVMREAGPEAAGRASYGFRLCVSRRPAPEELDYVVAYYQQELDRYQGDPEAARRVTQSENTTSETAQLAAWTTVSNLLLSLDETLTKE